MKRMAVLSVLILSLLFYVSPVFSGTHGQGVHWGYEGASGPAHWGDLSEDFKACKEGRSQSPVDINNTVKEKLPSIEFHYNNSTLKIINNGHTIKVNYAKGSYIIVNGKKYNLLQFHFHRPSENTVKGKHFDMEAHLVHKSDDGELAVVAVFMKEGKQNVFIKKVWDHLPEKVGHEENFKNVLINVSDFLPDNKEYYAFDGSLTTPPCTEGVKWLVLQTPVEVSAKQIKRFESFYRMNARPTQLLNGRVIKAGY